MPEVLICDIISDEGERAPLYQPPPKREVQIEEPSREDVERKSASIANAKKRKSIAALPPHGHADGVSPKSATSRSVSATSRVSPDVIHHKHIAPCIRSERTYQIQCYKQTIEI